MLDYIIIAIGAVCAILLLVLIILVLKQGKNNNEKELAVITDKLGGISGAMSDEFSKSRQETAQTLDRQRNETANALSNMNEKINEMSKANVESKMDLMETVNRKLTAIMEKNAEQNVAQTRAIEQSITKMQESNEKRLDEMRATVDEKLTTTLNDRLSTSFKTVSEQLQNVYKSLGEMKELSAGVTDNVKGLNRVLTNVKSRGTWAEVQLGNILDQTIPGMYETNVKTNPKYNGQVEFAVKIPSADGGEITWLPIDSKFPMEDYARLSEASEAGDLEALEAAKKSLEAVIKDEAKHIKQYISLPETTPFAIMYLATEGLYAEVVNSKNALAEKLQKDGIMVAGPSTITALLNSLQMGFRSIAINQKANEVFKVLGAAKAQYDKFGEQLRKARKNMEAASNAIAEADHRNSIIQKNLRSIESLDASESDNILGLTD